MVKRKVLVVRHNLDSLVMNLEYVVISKIGESRLCSVTIR